MNIFRIGINQVQSLYIAIKVGKYLKIISQDISKLGGKAWSNKFDEQRQAEKAIINFGYKATGVLIKNLENNNKNISSSCAYCLGEIGNPVAIKALLSLLSRKKSVDHYVISVTARSLNKLAAKGNHDMVAKIIHIIEDPDVKFYSKGSSPNPLESIIEALIKINDSSAFEPLKKFVSSSKSFECSLKSREIAISGLEKIGGKKAVQPLVEIILSSRNTDIYCKRHAIFTLAKIDDPDAQNMLMDLLHNPKLKESARDAIISTNNPIKKDLLLDILRDSESSTEKILTASKELKTLLNEELVPELLNILRRSFYHSSSKSSTFISGILDIIDDIAKKNFSSTNYLKHIDTLIEILFMPYSLYSSKPYKHNISEIVSRGKNQFSFIFGDYTKIILEASCAYTEILRGKPHKIYDGIRVDYVCDKGTQAINKLCEIDTPISSNILNKVLTKEYQLEERTTLFDGSVVVISLNYTSQKNAAQTALEKRKNPSYELNHYLNHENYRCNLIDK